MNRRSQSAAPGRTRILMASRRRGATGGTARRPIRTIDRPLTRLVPPLEPEEAHATQRGEDLWERHGRAAYRLACALLGDERAATQAVMLAMTDLARSSGAASVDDARRSLARHLYWRSQELASETTMPLRLPPAMVWIGQLAQLQRTCLALCLFGGLTHREAAALVGLPPMAVAGLLTSGLKELGQLAGGERPPVAD
jgi:DNA-directed RNA polymerase specialized sigma24 family protein